MKRLELTLEELPEAASTVCGMLENGVVILQGDLAAGKTTLVQAIADYMGVDEAVTSPTFSLQHCYGEQLFHYDIYNQGLEHFLSLGMLEELERPGLHLVEWGDDALVKLLKSAHIPTLVVKIEKCAPDKRCYEVEHA